MIPEVLDGLLWLARTAVRGGLTPVFAGHGYADPNFRPPSVPYLSVVGPLSLDPEPEREDRRSSHSLVQFPGYIAGQPRASSDVVPPDGELLLCFDHQARVTLRDLPGGSFASDVTGPSLAAAIESAVRTAAAEGGFVDLNGHPISDPTRLAELARATCRWDPERQRLLLCSGRYGAIADAEPKRSSVSVTGGSAAGPLGLEPLSEYHEGRVHRQQYRGPRAMAFDVRLDLWASTQVELASLVDGLTRAVPTRGRIVTRPALLAAPAARGDSQLRLLSEGEPTTRHSLMHLEAPDTFVDRVSRRSLEFTDGVSLVAQGALMQLAGTGTARAAIHPAPLIPDPNYVPHPAPRGVAISIGLGLTDELAVDQRLEVLQLAHQAKPVLKLEFERIETDGTPQLEIVGTAGLHQGGSHVARVTRWRMSAERFRSGVALHAVLAASSGVLELYVNGVLLPPAAGATGDPAAVAGGSDMRLTLGNPEGNPVPIYLSHVHLHSEPFGPLDPELRRSIATPGRFAPGDRLVLAECDDGYLAGSRREEVTVVGTSGDAVTVHPPLSQAWAPGATLAFGQEYFFQQRQLHRRDDLVNRLYRLYAEYRVSGTLEDATPELTAPLVEGQIWEVGVRTAGAGSRPSGGGERAMVNGTRHRS